MVGSQSRSGLESASAYSLRSHTMDLFDRFSRFFHGTFFCAAQIEYSNFNIRILNCSSPISNLFENADLHFEILLRTLATGLILPFEKCLSTFFVNLRFQRFRPDVYIYSLSSGPL